MLGSSWYDATEWVVFRVVLCVAFTSVLSRDAIVRRTAVVPMVSRNACSTGGAVLLRVRWGGLVWSVVLLLVLLLVLMIVVVTLLIILLK